MYIYIYRYNTNNTNTNNCYNNLSPVAPGAPTITNNYTHIMTIRIQL